MNNQNVLFIKSRQTYRVLNALLGFGIAAAIAFAIEYSETYKASGLIVLVLPIAGLVCEYIIIRLFKPDFEVRFLWVNIGAVAGMLLAFPLVITPRCGWMNDQCKPHTTQHLTR